MAEPISTEALQLLGEVAADPRSRLLSHGLRRIPGLDEAPWHPEATGLSAAERELLAVWRDEAARLLRRLVHQDLVQAGTAGTAGLVLTGPRHLHEELPREEGALRIESALRNLGTATRELASEADLAALLRARPMNRLQLAGLSLRLAPSPVSRTYVADELVLRGGYLAARRIHEQLLEEPGAAEHHGHSHAALALLHGSLGDHAPALAHARSASELCPSDSNATRAWLLMALQRGDLPEALEAARHLDDLPAESGREQAAWLGSLAAQSTVGRPLTPSGRVTAEQALERVSTTSRALLTNLLHLDETK